MSAPKSATAVIVGLALAACASGTPDWMRDRPEPGPAPAVGTGPGQKETAGTLAGAGTGALVGAA
ncbi:MAG: hypothetical protein WBR32_11885, partial [Pseudolabrys sp.]